jgi:hypothetical protein
MEARKKTEAKEPATRRTSSDRFLNSTLVLPTISPLLAAASSVCCQGAQKRNLKKLQKK